MDKRHLFISILLLLEVIALPVMASENLLKNSDFELCEDGRILNWYQSTAEPSAISLDEEEFVSGKKSLKIFHRKSESYSWFMQQVKVQPNSVYILTGYIRTQNVAIEPGGMGARVLIADERGNGIASITTMLGTNDWQEIKVEFATGDKTTINITPYLHKASGLVWFDKLKVYPKTAPPKSTIGVNLLKNNSFEEGKGTEIKNWSSNPAESGAVYVDSEIKYHGSCSLRIKHSKGDSYSSLIQLVDVEKDTNYLATVWIKAENVLPNPGGFAGRLFIGDKTGNGIASSNSIIGSSDWQMVTVPFFSGDNTRITIILYLHQASGTIWFDDARLVKEEKPKQEEQRGIPFKISGTIDSRIYYFQETSLKTDNYLRLSSSLKTSGASSILFYIYTCYESPGIGFEQKPERKFRPWLDYLTINLNGPLHPSLRPITVVLGQGWLNYSPYIAKINYDYGIRGQGIMASGLRWFEADWSGFLIWEGKKPYRNIGEGVRVKGGNGPWKYEVISVRSLEGNPSTNSEGMVIVLGDYRILETDFSLQLERKFNNGLGFNMLHVEQHKYTGQNKLTRARKMDFEFPFKKQKLSLSYRNFEPGFAPRYRDTTPKYGERGTKLGWNPVDQYKNQRGITIKSSGFFFSRPLHLELDSYCIQPECIDVRTNIILSMGGKTNYEFICTLDRDKEPLRYIEAALKRELARNNLVNLIGQVTVLHDRTGNNNNLKAQGTVIDYGFEASLKRGYLSGLTIAAGFQRFQKRYKYFRGQWQLFGNIQFKFSYRAPIDLNSNEDFWLDEYNRMHYRDNYISLNSVVYF